MFHPNYISPKKLIINDDILHLFKIIEKHGGILRFVGGAVRDAIAGFEHTDIDLVTDLSPSEIAEMCDEEGLKIVPLGIQFLTLGIWVNNSFLKLTSLYSEEETSDDWQKDASLRDLTINAVYADEKGNIFDYYNGISDLENGVIKFIGDPLKNIEYAPIRIMRFFRFCAYFGKNIDEISLKACIKNKSLLKSVSIEKIKEELFKLILAPYAVSTLKLIFEYNILDFLIAPPESIENFEKLENLISHLKLEKSIIRRIFILFTPNKQRVNRLSDIFRLTHMQKEHLLKLSTTKLTKNDFKDTVSITKSLYLYGKELCRDIWLYLNLKTTNIETVKKVLKQIEKTPIPLFPITKKDLILQGIEKKEIGFVLENLEKLWLDSGCLMSKQHLINIYLNSFKNSV